MCICAYSHEILFNFLPVSYAPFDLRNFAKMKNNTETVCQCNFSEIALQIFVQLCSFEVHDV